MSTRPPLARPRSRPGGGAVRVRRALVLAGCGVLGVGLSACESTEQESAKIGRESVAATPAASKPATSTHGARGHAHGAGGAAKTTTHGKGRTAK